MKSQRDLEPARSRHPLALQYVKHTSVLWIWRKPHHLYNARILVVQVELRKREFEMKEKGKEREWEIKKRELKMKEKEWELEQRERGRL